MSVPTAFVATPSEGESFTAGPFYIVSRVQGGQSNNLFELYELTLGPSTIDYHVHNTMDETLTVLSFGISDRLRHSLATTNAIESLLSRTRHVKRNVKRWRGGTMVVRWVAAGVLEAVKGFRRLKGHKAMPHLVAALRARDQQLGLVVDVENVA